MDRGRWRLLASKAVFYAAFLAAAAWLLAASPPTPALLATPAGAVAARAAIFAALAVLARFAHPEKPAWGAFAALALFAVALAYARPSGLAFLVAEVAGAAAAWLAKPPQQPSSVRGSGGD